MLKWEVVGDPGGGVDGVLPFPKQVQKPLVLGSVCTVNVVVQIGGAGKAARPQNSCRTANKAQSDTLVGWGTAEEKKALDDEHIWLFLLTLTTAHHQS